MKNSKILLVLGLLMTSLSGCSLGMMGNVQAEEANTLYLNLTRIGLYNDEVGEVIESKHIENGVVFTAPVGSPLPDHEVVTSSSGAEFVGWVVPNNLGGLQKINTVPSATNLILQAHFSTVSDSSSGEVITSQPNTSEGVLPGLYLKTSGQSYEQSIYLTEGYSTILNNTEYFALGLSVEAGFTFNLATPNDLSGHGAEILPTALSGKAGIGYTLSADPNVPNATGDYLKVNGTPLASGDASDGGEYYDFGTGTPGSLEFKSSGTFNIYITFWDNFGWARIYVEPAA